jgi:hypothetical protein
LLLAVARLAAAQDRSPRDLELAMILFQLLADTLPYRQILITHNVLAKS